MDITGYTEKVEAEQQAELDKAQAKKAEAKAKKDAELDAMIAKEMKAEADKKVAEEATQNEVVAIPSDKDIIISAVKSTFGEEAYVNVEYVDGINVAMVQVKKDVGFSAPSLRKQLQDNTIRLLKDLRDINGLQGVDVRAKTTDGLRIFEVRFNKNTLDTINYKTLRVADLPTVADKYWQHADMYDK